MTLKILVPCKRLREGKSRLASVLSGDERHALCREFLKTTLALASSVTASADCLLVSSDAEAVALAEAQNIASLGDDGKGLNPALQLGRDRLCGEEGSSLLILPIDLPRADTATLRNLVAAPADVVIAPDRARQGTNVLYLRSKAVGLDFRYGAGSFEAHRQLALDAGWSVEVFENPALSFDIDQPEDLAGWRRG